MLDKTPLEMALEREGQIEYCDECEYVRVVDNTVFCGLSGKLLHPMMFLRGQGFGPARRCTKRKEAREMGLTAASWERPRPPSTTTSRTAGATSASTARRRPAATTS